MDVLFQKKEAGGEVNNYTLLPYIMIVLLFFMFNIWYNIIFIEEKDEWIMRERVHC